jgi:hypothetical protein
MTPRVFLLFSENEETYLPKVGMNKMPVFVPDALLLGFACLPLLLNISVSK